MGHSTTQPATVSKPAVDSQNGRSFWFDFSTQASFLVFFLSTSWYMFGPEAATRAENLVQLIVIGVSFLTSAWMWLSATTVPRSYRLAILASSAVIVVLICLQLIAEYEESYRILKLARIENGRIVHDAMGLSYGLLSDWNPDLTVRMTMNANSTKIPEGRLAERLACGQSAVIGREIHHSPDSKNGIPSLITVEVEHDRSRVLNRFVRLVRSRELNLSTFPNIKLTQRTRDLQINGLHMVEYEFFEDRQKFYSRNVHLQAGKYILTFIMNSSVEADRERFDEFLRTIRVDSPFQLEQLFH